jgi:hypothetical protein
MAQCDVGLVPCNFQCDAFTCPGTLLGSDAGTNVESAPRHASASEPATIRALAERVAADNTVTAEIVIDSGDTPLGAYSLTVECDPTHVELLAIQPGTTPPFDGATLAQHIDTCRATLGGFQAATMMGPTGRVSVARVVFSVRAGVTPCSQSPLDLKVRGVYGTDGIPLKARSDAAILIIAPQDASCTFETPLLCSVAEEKSGRGAKSHRGVLVTDGTDRAVVDVGGAARFCEPLAPSSGPEEAAAAGWVDYPASERRKHTQAKNNGAT